MKVGCSVFGWGWSSSAERAECMSCTVVQLAANGSGWSSSSKMLDGFKVIEYETKITDHNVLRLYDPQGSGGTRSVNLGGKRTVSTEAS